MSKLYCANINYHLHDISPHTHISIAVVQADASKKSKHRERQRKGLSSKCRKQPPESLCFGERWRAYALWQVTLLSRLTSARANWPDFWQWGGQKPTEAPAHSRLVTFNAITFKEGTKRAITCESVYALQHLSSRKPLVCAGCFVVFAWNTQPPIDAALSMFCFSLTAVCAALGYNNIICLWVCFITLVTYDINLMP